MMKYINRFVSYLLFGVMLCAVVEVQVVDADAQVTTTQTTLSASLAGPGVGGSAPSQLCVASSTGIVAPGFTNPAQTGLMIDTEYMLVQSATPVSTCWIVSRGYSGTLVTAHASGARVWVGPTGGLSSSPFTNNSPTAGTPCTATAQPYLPRISVGAGYFQVKTGFVYNCPTTGPSANLWQEIAASGGAVGVFYAGLDAGANTALTVSIPGLSQAKGRCMNVTLAHTLQAGANTVALNGATAANIKSHFNVSNNLGTAYAATGTEALCYDGTQWVDMSE